MRTLYARELTTEERENVEAGLRSGDAFTVRRSQILLKSADEGLSPAKIGEHLYCSDQTVREAIHAFDAQGMDCLQAGSHARADPGCAFDEAGAAWLEKVIHQSPRQFGIERSLWTLQALAAVAHEQGYTDRLVSPVTISATLARQGITWRRAKHWITSPDGQYAVKKNAVTG